MKSISAIILIQIVVQIVAINAQKLKENLRVKKLKNIFHCYYSYIKMYKDDNNELLIL